MLLHSCKRGFVLLAAILLLGCLSGCGSARRVLPDAPTEPTSYLIVDPVPETTETETLPTETETETTEATTEPVKETRPDGLTGTVTGTNLNIRTGPSINYGSSETLEAGTEVLILEVDATGSLPWGRIDRGWICLDYVLLDDPDAVLPYTSSAVGISINSGIPVYSGPGTNYNRTGTLGKNVRLNIFGVFGNWARITEGWILLDHAYLDGEEGPSPAVMGTVTGNGVYVRSGPGGEYGFITTCSSGTRVKILYQATISGYTWGCMENGWISMDYVLLDTDPAAAILGTWYGHTAQSADSSLDHTFTEWTFRYNGTYTCTRWSYNETADEAVKFQDGHSEGSYTYKEGKLELDNGAVGYLDGGKLYINEGYSTKAYVKTSMDDAISLFLAEKYPPAPPSEPEDSGDDSGSGDPPADGGET